tara:strand:- start:363 stop:953 length:591 start_codon:yes stop_codon:yes gene_type:complete
MRKETLSTCIDHKGYNQNIIDSLDEGHMIKTLMEEHAHIVSMLDELTNISNQLKGTDIKNNKELFQGANHLILKIIGAEPHHQREERVLFPALEKLGITGPPQCMAMEHDIMRTMKHDLNQKLSFDDIMAVDIDEIKDLIEKLCDTLRNHIHKEDTILFPLALQSINNDSQWIDMRVQCDEIGYCCFCQKLTKNES